MSAEKISVTKAIKYKKYIPEEYFKGIMTKEIRGIAGFFAGEFAGTLLYEQDGNTIVLKSLYVAPEYRRLGIATEMFELLPKGDISFSYEAVDDRVTLEPFFEAMDVDLTRLDVPMADITIEMAKKSLKRVDSQRAGEYGLFLDELDPEQEAVVVDWFENGFGERNLTENIYAPFSIFYIENNEVKGAIFIREDEATDYDIVMGGPNTAPDAILDIDYLFCKAANKKVLPGMMNKLLRRISKEYSDTTRIQGYLMNEDGLALYNALFQQPGTFIPFFFT